MDAPWKLPRPEKLLRPSSTLQTSSVSLNDDTRAQSMTQLKILPWKCAFSLIEAAKYEVEKLVRGNAKPRRNAEVEGCRLLKWRSWTNEANFFDRAITTTWSALFYYLQHGELPIVMKEHTVQGHWWKKLYPQNEISLELNELRSFKVMPSS